MTLTIASFVSYPSNVDPTKLPLRFKLTADIAQLALRAGSTGTIRQGADGALELEFDVSQPSLFHWENTLSIFPDDTDADIIKAIQVMPAAPPRFSKPRPVEHALPWLSGLATLGVSVPWACWGAAHMGGRGMIPFTLLIVWTTSRFGWRGGLPLSVASIIAHKVFVEPYMYTGDTLSPKQYAGILATFLAVTFMREGVAFWENSVRPRLASLANLLFRRLTKN